MIVFKYMDFLLTAYDVHDSIDFILRYLHLVFYLLLHSSSTSASMYMLSLFLDVKQQIPFPFWCLKCMHSLVPCVYLSLYSGIFNSIKINLYP